MGINRESDLGIRRSLFGYRPAAVRDLLVETDWVQRRAESELLAAETRIEELQGALASMEDEVSRRDEQLHALQAEVARLEDRTADGRPLFVTAEVSSILASAQDAASRIVERARSVSDRMLEEHRQQDRLQADVARLTAWRDEAVPVIRAVRESVERSRRELDRVARRIEDSLSPLEELSAGWMEIEPDGQVTQGEMINDRRSPVYQLIG